MKYSLSSIISISIFISLSIIINNIIWINWINRTNIQHELYIFIGIISLLCSSLYLLLRYCYIFNKNKETLNNVMCLISFFMLILWVIAYIYVYIVYNIYSVNDKIDKIFSIFLFNVIFGFSELCIWTIILCITIKRFLEKYKRDPALEAQASHEIYSNQ